MTDSEKKPTILTVNQIVARSLTTARKSKGWTQSEAAERLAPYLGTKWSKATLSAAERSFERPERIRQFTADDIVAFATAFELPVQYFFVPPVRGDQEELRIASGDPDTSELLPLPDYLTHAFGSVAGIKAVERRLAATLKALPDEVAGRDRDTFKESLRSLARAKATNDELMVWRDALLAMLEIVTMTLIDRELGQMMPGIEDTLRKFRQWQQPSGDTTDDVGEMAEGET